MTETRLRWSMLALLFAARTGLGFQFQTLGSVSTALDDAFGLSYTEIGTLIGAFMLPGLALALPAGFAGRRFSDRTLVTIGLLSLAAGGALAAIASGFGLLFAGRLVCGLGFVISTIYFTKMVADWFAGKELATAMGVLVMSWPFGIAMGQIGHEWLAIAYQWRVAFSVASIYCAIGALGIGLLYRAPADSKTGPAAQTTRLPRNELALTLLASTVWALFNAGYIVFLSFGPQVLVAGGYSPVKAAAVLSVASWLMIVSGAACGQIADRTKRPDAVLYTCMAAAVLALVALPLTDFALAFSLLFGLIGMAPAGVIMALTAEAMAPDHRALGMGVFFTGYFLVVAPAPAIAGWLYDRSGDPYSPVLFGAALFALTALGNAAFRIAQRRLPAPGARAAAGA